MVTRFDIARALEIARDRFIDGLSELVVPVAVLGVAAVAFTAFVQYVSQSLGRRRSRPVR